MIKGYIIFIAFVGLLFIVPGCGEGDDIEDAQPTDTITINPSTSTISDDMPSTTTHTQYFHIVVKNANGIPLRNIKLTIEFIWALPDIYGVVQLYHGDTKVDSPFNALTDDNGAYILRMDFDSGLLEYNGTLQVTSGSAYASADFAVDTG